MRTAQTRNRHGGPIVQAKWYVSKNGEVLGPLSEFALCSLLRAGQLEWLDFAVTLAPTSSEASASVKPCWQPLIKFENLRAHVAVEPVTARSGSALNQSGWTVRIQRPGQPVRMAGPLSAEDVLGGIKNGTISFGDLAWRDGMKTWLRVGDVTDFGARPRIESAPVAAAVANIPDQASREELLAAVVRPGELTRPWPEKPPEANGEDLVGAPDWMKVLMLGLTLGLTFGLTIFFSGPLLAATKIEIVPLKLNAQPSLVFETDAGDSDLIAVDVSGRSGEILERASYHRHFEVSRRPGELPTLNLADLGLPMGTYQIRARVGEGPGAVQSEKEIFVGTKDRNFDTALAQHVKQTAAQRQSEKKTLFYSARGLEALSTRLARVSKSSDRLGRNWTEFTRDARRDLAKTKSDLDGLAAPDALAYPEQVAALREAVGSFDRALDLLAAPAFRTPAGETNGAASKDGGGATAIVAQARDLVQVFGQLKNQFSVLSLERTSKP